MAPEPPPTPEPPGSRRAALIRLGLFAALLAAILLAVRLTGPDFSATAIRGWAEDAGVLAPLLIVVATVVLSSIGVPAPALAGATGLLFGTALGTLVALPAITLAATTQMLIGRHLAHEQAGRLVPARLRRVDDFLARRGFFAVLYYRIIPGLPFIALNYGAGLTKLRLRDMAGGTAIGKAPNTFAYTALGGGLLDLGAPEVRVAVVLLAVLALGGIVLARRELRAERAAAAEAG